jgi:hypothetical protein
VALSLAFLLAVLGFIIAYYSAPIRYLGNFNVEGESVSFEEMKNHLNKERQRYFNNNYDAYYLAYRDFVKTTHTVSWDGPISLRIWKEVFPGETFPPSKQYNWLLYMLPSALIVMVAFVVWPPDTSSPSKQKRFTTSSVRV